MVENNCAFRNLIRPKGYVKIAVGEFFMNKTDRVVRLCSELATQGLLIKPLDITCQLPKCTKSDCPIGQFDGDLTMTFPYALFMYKKKVEALKTE